MTPSSSQLDHTSCAAIQATPGVTCRAACIAIAGPVKAGATEVHLTNYRGGPEERLIKLSDLPPALCPVGATVFINDLESTAEGVIALSQVCCLC
jgi:glucokinase